MPCISNLSGGKIKKRNSAMDLIFAESLLCARLFWFFFFLNKVVVVFFCFF